MLESNTRQCLSARSQPAADPSARGLPRRWRRGVLGLFGLLVPSLGLLSLPSACSEWTGVCWNDDPCGDEQVCDRSRHVCVPRSTISDGGDSTSDMNPAATVCQQWNVQSLTLTFPDFSPPLNTDGFGSALALGESGELFIGAPNHSDGAALNVGAIYVASGTGTNYTVSQLLLPAVSASNLSLGTELAVGGTTLLSAPGDNINGRGAPLAVYSFAKSGKTWAGGTMLTDPAGGANGLGRSLAFDGQYPAYVGAPVSSAMGGVYTLDAPRTLRVAIGFPTPPANFTNFGQTLAMTSSLLFVGGPSANETITPSSHVFAYQRGSSPSLYGEIPRPTDLMDGDYFGNGLAADGGTLLVRTRNAVYVYRQDGSAFVQKAKLEIKDSVVALVNENQALIGAPKSGTGGQVFSYDLTPLWSNGQPARTDLSVPGLTNAYFGGAIAARGGVVIVAATEPLPYSQKLYTLTCQR